MTDEEMAAIQQRTSSLQIVYFVLFGSSLVILVLQAMVLGWGGLPTLLWALTLGGAVATRLYRSSLVQKLNTAMLERGHVAGDDP